MTTMINNANNVTFDGFAIDGRNDVGTIEADADPVHFKMHKDNPTFIPHQDMIVLEFIGVALTLIPDLFH